MLQCEEGPDTWSLVQRNLVTIGLRLGFLVDESSRALGTPLLFVILFFLNPVPFILLSYSR